jgi:hypothetical protein
MKHLCELLKRKESSSAVLRKALAEIDVPAAERRVDELEAERRALLLSGTDREVQAIDDRIAAENRKVERLIVMRQELERRIADAEKLEANEALSAELAGVVKKREATIRAIVDGYPPLAAAIVEILEGIGETEEAIVNVNSKLHAAGRPDESLKPIESSIFPDWRHYPMSLRSTIRLPAFNDGFARGWAYSEFHAVRGPAE